MASLPIQADGSDLVFDSTDLTSPFLFLPSVRGLMYWPGPGRFGSAPICLSTTALRAARQRPKEARDWPVSVMVAFLLLLRVRGRAGRCGAVLALSGCFALRARAGAALAVRGRAVCSAGWA